MGKKVRVLVGCVIGGIKFKPDQVVDLPDALAKAHAASGEVDPHKDAVAYCVDELKAEVIAYAAPQSEVEAESGSAQDVL